MHRNRIFILTAGILWSLVMISQVDAEPAAQGPATRGNGKKSDPIKQLIQRSASQLIKLQEKDGAWPYEGVYRVGGKIPVGYRVGGTSIVCTALMHSPARDPKAVEQAISRGVGLILKEIEDPLMRPSTENRYDVRVWGHIYALDFFCRLHNETRLKEERKRTDPWIQKLVDTLVKEELRSGGWNYATRRQHASFVTAPAVQSLLLARATGAKVPAEIFNRSADVLKKSRTEKGAFQYSGIVEGGFYKSPLPGSIARGAICETTLVLLGQGNPEHLQASIDAFHKHWVELEKRRKKTGTHRPPYNVAPYYFYYGHRYLAQAIRFLPKENQAKEIKRFAKVLLRTKDDDHTWNDRVFDRTKAFGTAMAVLSLQPGVPVPETIDSKAKK